MPGAGSVQLTATRRQRSTFQSFLINSQRRELIGLFTAYPVLELQVSGR